MYIKSKLFSFKFVNMYYSTLDLLQRTGTLLVKINLLLVTLTKTAELWNNGSL